MPSFPFKKEDLGVERAVEVIGGVFHDALEANYGKEELSVAFASVCLNEGETIEAKGKPKRKTDDGREKPRCFVEFCCREGSEISGLAKQFGIEYSGLSKEFRSCQPSTVPTSVGVGLVRDCGWEGA